MVSSPRGIAAISPGDRVAQMLLLPSLHGLYPARQKDIHKDAFGSTGSDFTFLSFGMDQRPIIQLKINGKNILGLLDTGADKSIIASKDWPRNWPIQVSSQTLQGLGYAKTPNISASILAWEDPERHSGQFQPYVLELPVSLWGRDLLQDMDFKLSNDCSLPSQKMMQSMGYHPSHGIGKNLQGKRIPF